MNDHFAGKSAVQLPQGVTATAVYGGPNNCYRYRLDWTWSDTQPVLLACMMNPSTATEYQGDATLSWVYRWATLKGFGKLIVVNADAYRCTDQMRLAEVSDPCGPKNMIHILRAANDADLICVGYGHPKVHRVRYHGPRMARTLIEAGHILHAWKRCRDGTPSHPLYLPSDVAAVLWSPQ
jgi:hypothetical protein